MKKVIIIYSEMIIGGSTTSLLSFLNSFDYSKYKVDLQLYSNDGPLQQSINTNVNVLPDLKSNIKKYKKFLLPHYYINVIQSRYSARKLSNNVTYAQYLAKYEAICCDAVDEEYDIGISYLEFFPMEYLGRNIKAKKKISWIHIDVKEAGLLKRISKEIFDRVDKIVLVSESCVASLEELYPSVCGKTCVIENMLNQITIREFAKASTEINVPNDNKVNFVSVCRIVFSHKGLDRCVKAFSRLMTEGCVTDDYRWYIIGDGIDLQSMKKLVKDYNIEDNVIFLGPQNNPYCIEKNMDVFLLPSRYEGKPMAVTEAQMLGLIPLVCNYSSAKEQINDGIDGFIAENNDFDIYYKIKDILARNVDITRMKTAIYSHDYSNTDEMKKVYKLFEEE